MKESKPYESILIAKYILSVAHNKGVPLNMTQLQKILFICYGYFLSQKDFILLNEAPKAWPYGPVFPKTQKKIKLNDYLDLSESCFMEIEDQTKNIIDIVVDLYKNISATALSNWTHLVDSPWEKTTRLDGFKWNHPIPDQFTKEYFSNIKVIG